MKFPRPPRHERRTGDVGDLSGDPDRRVALAVRPEQGANCALIHRSKTGVQQAWDRSGAAIVRRFCKADHHSMVGAMPLKGSALKAASERLRSRGSLAISNSLPQP